jgi:hypothetical protein
MVIPKFIVEAFSPFGRIVDTQDLIVCEQHLPDESFVAHIFNRIGFDLLQVRLRKFGVLQRRIAIGHVHLSGARLFCIATDQVQLNNDPHHRAECGNGETICATFPLVGATLAFLSSCSFGGSGPSHLPTVYKARNAGNLAGLILEMLRGSAPSICLSSLTCESPVRKDLVMLDLTPMNRSDVAL